MVLVPNATTGVNTVLHNLRWNDDGKDEIIQLDIIYGACGKTASYICESNQWRVRTREVTFTHPAEDSKIVATFQRAIQTSKAQGHRPRVAIFDTIASNPGIRLPFKELASVCRSEGVLNLVDAAHGIGQIELDIPSWDPDFLVSNCHKWLYTPRGCAVLYVPERNQGIIRTTLPTSHGYIESDRPNDSKGITKSAAPNFVNNFEFVGTMDSLAYLTVAQAIEWRQQVCGGEEKIRDYCISLAKRGGRQVADILGTRVLDNASHSLTDCFMVNILLPVQRPTTGSGSRVQSEDGAEKTVSEWVQRTLIEDWNTYMPVFPFQGSWWVRISGQVYLDDSDFEWAGQTLKAVCEQLEQQRFV